MFSFFSFLLARLIEPSSLAGVGLVINGAHTAGSGNLVSGIGQVAAGVAAFLVPEPQVQGSAGGQPASNQPAK
jgi:hypothetical protein